MEGNKVKALAKAIMEAHSMWELDTDTGERKCTGEGCGFVLTDDRIPSQEVRLNHQLEKLAEAGFTFVDEPEKDKFGSIIGETIESPGMVRWYNDSHYFLKRIGNMWEGVRKPDTFVLGLENRIADGAYLFSTSIEFDNDEAPDLMDRIADFNGLPKYTDMQKQLERTRKQLEAVLTDLNAPSFSDTVDKSRVSAKLERIVEEL